MVLTNDTYITPTPTFPNLVPVPANTDNVQVSLYLSTLSGASIDGSGVLIIPT